MALNQTYWIQKTSVILSTSTLLRLDLIWLSKFQSSLSFESFIQPTASTFELVAFEVSEITKIIQNLPTNKASGLDGIPARLLKLCAPTVAKPLAHIFNLSINHGVLPIDWKNARVTPIYKEGSRASFNNYRPISVLLVIAKILEQAVFNQFYIYLHDNNPLSEHQSGFRPLHSSYSSIAHH